ncbi:MAG TPA: hypothetical protein VGG97_23220 [Bryobacteraceae bacterium]|jgi:hypothetical protein
MTNQITFVSLWILLVLAVLGLALYRKFTSTQADNYVHVSEGEARLISHQVAVNQKIEKIDRLGETLTIITLFAGLALACIYVYSALYSR